MIDTIITPTVSDYEPSARRCELECSISITTSHADAAKAPRHDALPPNTDLSWFLHAFAFALLIHAGWTVKEEWNGTIEGGCLHLFGVEGNGCGVDGPRMMRWKRLDDVDRWKRD